MNDISFWSQVYPYALLIICMLVASIPFCPEPFIWLWRRLRKASEAPIDFQSIHEERKSLKNERRTKRLERREERIGRRGRPIE